MTAALASQLSLFNPEHIAPRAAGSRRSRNTLEALFPDYELVRLSAKKQSTVTKYRDSLAHWAAAGLADVEVGQITTSEVLRFYRHLLQTPGRYGAESLSDHSIHFHLARIRSVLRFACDKRRLIPFVPDFPQHAIDDAKKLKRYWVSREEIEQVLASPALAKKRTPKLRVDGRRVPRVRWWRAILYVTWWTALRISETLALTWSDLDGDVLTIRPTVKRSKHARVVVLDARCLELLAGLRPHEPQPGQTIFAGLAPHANLARHFTRLFAWAGVKLPPGSAWHSLRRGRCESEFLAGGREYAQARLGHRDLATTEASYLREEIERAESIEQQRRLMAESSVGRQEPEPTEQEPTEGTEGTEHGHN